MPLSIGTRLGVYEVVALIGAGGMGEVYRARDTRLNREVALKVLPESLAADKDRLARFKREAQLLASLNHQNIASIHGFEEGSALIMEFIEGPTLADRIAQGPLPVDEALSVARQIADALEAAHEQGVIHRDLKPANIKLRPDGTVKVLDFGLAKAFEGEAAPADVSQSPTLSVAATHMGVILGTAAYMAPEQAKGKKVDKRADIWAFGCVVYEMLTGRPAFAGEDISEILASVIKGGADFDLIPAAADPRIREVLARCVEKDVRKRFRDIGDVRFELEQILLAPGGRQVERAGPPQPARRTLGWVAAAATVTAIVVGTSIWFLKPAPPSAPAPVTRFAYALPENQTFRSANWSVLAISPDGSQFVYNTAGGLYLRSMDDLTARRISGTENNLANPFFSPDGQWVGFLSAADSELKKIPIAGGTAIALCSWTNGSSASWGADDTILFVQSEGIFRVSANGGTPVLVVAANKGERLDAPQMLRGGWVLFSVIGAGQRWDEGEIVAQSLETRERKVLWKGGSDARFVPPGHLMYALGDSLFALSFNPDSLQVSGGPVPLLSGVQRAAVGGAVTATANYGVSSTGTLVYVVASSTAGRTLAWVDRNGEEAIAAPPRAYVYPRISPDGMQVALDVRDQDNDIWIWSLPRKTLTRLTFNPGLDRYPVWTPDGRRIAFSSQHGDAPNLFWQAADGSGTVDRLTEGMDTQYPTSFSRDGMNLLFEDQTPRGFDVQMLALGAERRSTSLLATPFAERNADLSHDGRWVAYESDESGRIEVWVRPFPRIDAGRWQLSTGGGSEPLWAPDDRQLYFVDTEGRIVAVPTQTAGSFVVGNTQVVVDNPRVRNPPGTNGRVYDVSPDGRRFLVIKESTIGGQSAPPPQIMVVTNWIEELKRRVPAK